MKLLLISSSPNKEKSWTFLLAKEVVRGFSEVSAESEMLHLCDLKIDFCKHCEECHKKIMHCSVEDSGPAVLKKMLEADAIILASPNYINQITASMKALFDRSSHFIHCKRLMGKYIAGVVSSGSGQDKAVLNYIEYYAHTCGAQFSGGISSRVPVDDEKLGEAYELGHRLASDVKEKRTYPDQAEIIEKEKRHFLQVMKARKNDWQEEYQYWLDKGWL